MRKLSLTVGILFCLANSALGQDRTSTQSGYWGLIAAFGCVVVALILANAYVVSLFHAKGRGDTGALARWNEKWEFSAQALGGFSWWQLALWSLLSLFFELLMIRWISSEIRIFAYLRTSCWSPASWALGWDAIYRGADCSSTCSHADCHPSPG